jgi:hypothetical protein
VAIAGPSTGSSIFGINKQNTKKHNDSLYKKVFSLRRNTITVLSKANKDSANKMTSRQIGLFSNGTK